MEENNNELDMAIAKIYTGFLSSNSTSITNNEYLPNEENPMNISLQNDIETEELRKLLSEWNQEFLLEHLISQKVFLNVLRVVKRHHIHTLILKDFEPGIQILFEHYLEQWRESIGSPLPNYYGDIPSPYFLPTENSSPISSPSCSPRALTPNSVHPYASTSASTSAQENRVDTISLSDVLLENTKGATLIEYYTKYSKFDEEQRTALINLIVQVFEGRNIKMSLSTSFNMEKQILERFPTEKMEYYRTGKRGRIYNRYVNSTTSFRSVMKQTSKVRHNPKTSSRPGINLEVEADAENYIRALKFDNLTAEQFDATWKACAHSRLSDIKSLVSTTSIMDKWPFYRSPTGFRLIDMDYNILFNNGDALITRWIECREDIVKFLSSDGILKDKSAKVLIENVKINGTINENSRDGAIFLALHGYFVPTGKMVKKDSTGKPSTFKFTIKDSQNSFIYIVNTMEEFEEYLQYLKSQNTSIQPFIFIIGKDIFDIEGIYLYFDNIKYKFLNLLRAVDICFKTIYLFNLNFPKEAIMFYTFIEAFFFNFKSEQNFRKIEVMKDVLKKN